MDVLNSVGWCQPAGMGVAPVSSTELLAWSTGADVPLAPWEFLALREASQAFCSQKADTDLREPTFDPADQPPVSPIRALAQALNRPKDTP